MDILERYWTQLVPTSGSQPQFMGGGRPENLKNAQRMLTLIEPLHRHGRMRRPSCFSASTPSKQILHCFWGSSCWSDIGRC